jgi:hypothetical protein
LLFFLFLAEVASAPNLTVVTAAAPLTGNFTLVMADADVVGTNKSAEQTRHWLVNDVTLISESASRLDENPHPPAAYTSRSC